MTINMELAEKLSKKLWANAETEDVRDFVDMRTGGELDCTQLDLLTDWVMEKHRRLALGK